MGMIFMKIPCCKTQRKSVLFPVFRIRSVSDRIRIPVLKKPGSGSGSRISDPDPGSWSIKICESISLECAVVMCRFISKRACRTWFYPVKIFWSPWGWFCADPVMNFNKRYENLELMLLKIFVEIRIRDPRSGCSDRIRIPTCQNTRIRPDPDPKHWFAVYPYLS